MMQLKKEASNLTEFSYDEKQKKENRNVWFSHSGLFFNLSKASSHIIVYGSSSLLGSIAKLSSMDTAPIKLVFFWGAFLVCYHK